MERKKLELLMSVVLILCACALAHSGWKQAASGSVENRGKKTVVIDAGQAGRKKRAGGVFL